MRVKRGNDLDWKDEGPRQTAHTGALVGRLYEEGFRPMPAETGWRKTSSTWLQSNRAPAFTRQSQPVPVGTVICAHCGKVAPRSNPKLAAYCSGACKTAAYRARRRAEATA